MAAPIKVDISLNKSNLWKIVKKKVSIFYLSKELQNADLPFLAAIF